MLKNCHTICENHCSTAYKSPGQINAYTVNPGCFLTEGCLDSLFLNKSHEGNQGSRKVPSAVTRGVNISTVQRPY